MCNAPTTTAQLYPDRDTFEFDQLGARDEESTNHNAHLAE